MTSMDGFALTLDDLAPVAQGLKRPECVVATKDGDLYTCDTRGAICRIAPDGSQQIFGSPTLTAEGFKANGFSLMPDGTFIFANIGARGGVWKMDRSGVITPVLEQVDGMPMPSTNFVWRDLKGRLWVCVSTAQTDSHGEEHCFGEGQRADGFIALIDNHGARIVADGLGWTNECRIDPTGNWLYVNETMARRMSRFRLGADGSLSGRETVAEFPEGTFPDGLTFDVEGGIWVTSPLSNRLLRVTPEGEPVLLLEDNDPADLAKSIEAFRNGTLARSAFGIVPAGKLKNITSLAFGGPDLKTAYLGSLAGQNLYSFRVPVAGVAQAHWG